MEKMNEISIVENGVSVLSVSNSSNLQPYCSIKAENFEDRKKLFNYINSPNKKVSECINEVINLKDIYIGVVPITNEDTGEVTECMRTVLIDTDGNAYQAVSSGIFNATRNLLYICGEPSDWECPITIKFRQLKKGVNTIFTFDTQF